MTARTASTGSSGSTSRTGTPRSLASTSSRAADAADPRHPRAENATTRSVDRFFALATDGRFDEAAQCLTTDIVRVDHRTAVSDATTHGRDEYMAALRGAFDVGFDAVTIDHLAVRGERLNLMRTSFATEGDMHLVILSVCETDGDGLVSRIALYDDNALDDAVAELEARYVAGEGRPHAAVLETVAQSSVASNAKDWACTRSLYNEDFTFVDHTPVGWPDLDLDGYIQIQQSYSDQVQLTSLTRWIHVLDRTMLATAETIGTDAAGGTFEWAFHGVSTFDAEHRYLRSEMYAEDDFDAALARFDELAAGAPGPARPAGLENAATRWTRRLNELINGGGLDEVAEMYAVDVVAVDRRSVVSAPTLRGRSAIRDNLKALRDVGLDRFRSEPLAVRGDRLVLQRVAFSTDDGREMKTLSVHEWADGKVVYRAVFDEDALDEALAELEERYLAGEGAPHASLLELTNAATRVLQGYEDAFPARDWSWFRTALADDIVNDDRRPTVSSGPSVGREETIALNEALASVGFAALTHDADRDTRGAPRPVPPGVPQGRRLRSGSPRGDGARRCRSGRPQRALRSRRPSRRTDRARPPVRRRRGGGTRRRDARARRSRCRDEPPRPRRRRPRDTPPTTPSYDHSLIGFGVLGKQAYREYLEAAFEQTPDFRFIPATLEIDGNIALTTISSRGVTRTGFRIRTRHRPRDAFRRRHAHRRGPLLRGNPSMAEARDLFRTLAAASDRPAPEIRNAVTGAIDRYAARLGDR